MARVFEDWGEGQTLKAAAAMAIAVCALATAAGTAAERFVERRLEAESSAAPVAARASNAIDYATTASIPGENRRRRVVLGPCGEP